MNEKEREKRGRKRERELEMEAARNRVSKMKVGRFRGLDGDVRLRFPRSITHEKSGGGIRFEGYDASLVTVYFYGLSHARRL